MATPNWLSLQRGAAPLILAVPHSGSAIPDAIAERLVSPWLARKDADWWVDLLYDFGADLAPDLGVTLLRTDISRTVIDVNRDPSGASLYPGQATTGLCPTESFDGEPLYRTGCKPDQDEIEARRLAYFAPYHQALKSEIDRLRQLHGKLVLFDAHSIRSVIPRLFAGQLPNFNIGNNRGASCDGELLDSVEAACRASDFSCIVNGRFVGGWTTRHYGRPQHGVHAIQMELAMRGYLDEPSDCTPDNWPPAYSPDRAAALRAVLLQILRSALAFADKASRTP